MRLPVTWFQLASLSKIPYASVMSVDERPWVVVASGARCSGPTVHFVNEEFDKGKIVAQRVVPVKPDDTPDDVAARVLKAREGEGKGRKVRMCLS